MANFHILNSWCNLILTGIGNPILFSLLGSRMAINLKEAGESETKGDFTNHWKPNLKSILSEPQFAAPAGMSFHEFFWLFTSHLHI